MENKSRSLLCYNVYVVNNWKKISSEVLANVPHDIIHVNITFDLRYIFSALYAYFFFRRMAGIRRITFSQNHAQYGEYFGFKKLIIDADLDEYHILTYAHSKGVTRPNDPRSNDWRELMRYFTFDRFNDAVAAFEEGFSLYGVNLSQYDGRLPRQHAYKYADFWYRGSFVTVNLEKLRKRIKMASITPDFYAAESFWGQICSIDEAFCAHESGISPYKERYPGSAYKTDQE